MSAMAIFQQLSKQRGSRPYDEGVFSSDSGIIGAFLPRFMNRSLPKGNTLFSCQPAFGPCCSSFYSYSC